MNVSKKNSWLINRFLIKEGFSQSLKDIKNKNLLFMSFFIVPLFYSPLLFSDLNKEGMSECPSLPKITATMVYQSVQAPQIEPRNQQVFEGDPSHPSFDSYDLVANKPAVVLLSLKPPENIKEDGEYKISLKVNDGEAITEPAVRCSKVFNKIELSTGDHDFSVSERKCKLKNRHFRTIIKRVKKKKEYMERAGETDIHNLNIFVEIPTKYKGDLRSITKNLSVFIASQENPSCISEPKEISVTIRKTSPLHLDFVNLAYDEKKGAYCKKNIEVSDYDIINQFANSKEVNEYLPIMYPIGEKQVSSGVITDPIYSLCSDTDHPNVRATRGVLFDVLSAQVVSNWHYINNNLHLLDIFEETGKHPIPLTKEGFDALNSKLIVIVSKKYMEYHKLKDTAGFIVRPEIRDNELIGSWNVAFVSEETLEDELARGKDKAQGIVLHEVAHTLGQGKEYYAEIDKTDPEKKPLPDDQQIHWCSKFFEKQEPCHKYKIFGGLMASFKDRIWRFVNDKTPFMNNEQTTIDNLGIDRETFQKLFQTLHHENLDPTSSREQELIQKSLERAPVVSLSGLYDKKTGQFYNDFSIVHNKAFPNFSQKKGSLEVLLTKRITGKASIEYKILSKAYPITEIEMEVLFREGGGETFDLDVVPITVSLSIPGHYLENEELKKDLRLIVREAFYRREPVRSGSSYIQKASFEEEEQSEFSQTGRIIYEAEIDWSAKLEDLLIKRKR